MVYCKNTRGVTGFVGPASKPIPLTDREIAVLGIEDEMKQTIKVSL